MADGKTTKYYKTHPEAKKKKDAYNKEFNKKKEQRKKRSELIKKNREADKRGVDRSGRDYDHASKKYVDSSKNRGRTKSANGSKDGNARGKKK